MPDDVETLQKMVRWLARKLEDEADASYGTSFQSEEQYERNVQGWIDDARTGVTYE